MINRDCATGTREVSGLKPRISSIAITRAIALTWLLQMNAVPHDLKGWNAIEGEHMVPHGTTDASFIGQPWHGYKREMTEAERLATATRARAFISQQHWTSQQIRQTSPATRSYDCHGLTLDEGISVIDNKDAEDVARYKGYRPIKSPPAEGDIVIYRYHGRVTHSGLVIEVRGETVRVHSKWGEWPDYIHDIDAVPDDYGKPEIWRR